MTVVTQLINGRGLSHLAAAYPLQQGAVLIGSMRNLRLESCTGLAAGGGRQAGDGVHSSVLPHSPASRAPSFRSVQAGCSRSCPWGSGPQQTHTGISEVSGGGGYPVMWG